MIRLIVNADDLGMHAAIDRGILRAHRDGLVSSTTVLVNGRTAVAAVASARAQGLPMGVHLAAVTGLAPVLSSTQTLAPNGVFRSSWRAFVTDYARGAISLSELHAEWRAQILRARDLGVEPDHLDAHQHLHVLPGVQAVVAKLSREFDLPVRRPSVRAWRPRLQGADVKALLLGVLGLPLKRLRSVPMLAIELSGTLTEASLQTLLSRLGPGVYEVGCHPGEDPGVIAEDPTWRYEWQRELDSLTSVSLKAWFAQRDVQLTSYREVFAT